MTTPHRPTVLLIRDGWGKNPNPGHDAFNAVLHARTPVADRIEAEWPTTLIATSGEDVGLTEGTMGNSEVGHQNIGAGRVVDQDAVRITKVCREGRLGEIGSLRSAIETARDGGRSVHLMGIASDAGVHGQLDHLYALVELCKSLDMPRVFVHLFTDGRDTGPFTGRGFIEQVEDRLGEIGVGRIASLCGRYWAMDRDNRWERVRRAYDVLTGRGEASVFDTADAAIGHAYDHPEGETLRGDEFVPPRVVGEPTGSRITDGDTVVFYNYRGDRPREICAAFLEPEFHGSESLKPSPDSGERGFDRGERLGLNFVLMTPYSEHLATLAPVAFPKPPKMANTLGEWVSAKSVTQFRCAETEKFPHVTFFFNDYRDDPFDGERREIVQSPKVATYDMQPEMSARGVADAVLARLDADDAEGLIVVNFANSDMVGHTGSFDAAVKACETVDALTGEIIERTLARGGALVVTADHGNSEQMFDPATDAAHTAHTTYTVPLTVIADSVKGRRLVEGGRLADIAPTVLELMGLEVPSEMTGGSLLASD